MNRKYIVDKSTRHYLCVALQKGTGWTPVNQESLAGFMATCTSTSQENPEEELLSGEYNDNTFFEKWIRNGTNFLFRY
jgi:hypothetical protein